MTLLDPLHKQASYYFVFGTGRCGTAMLAQYFGGVSKDRQEWKRRGANLVAHEPMDLDARYWKAIEQVKKGNATAFADLFLAHVGNQEKFGRCLITDNKIGRWFFGEIRRLGVDARVIYLHRARQEVLNSLRKRSPLAEDRRWCYERSDAHTLATEKSPYEFHVSETELQWNCLKRRLSPRDYLEVSYHQFLTNRRERGMVENFVSMDGIEQLVGRITNSSSNQFAP